MLLIARIGYTASGVLALIASRLFLQAAGSTRGQDTVHIVMACACVVFGVALLVMGWPL